MRAFYEPPENGATDVKDGSVEFDHVSFRYSGKNKKFALTDIDLKIPSGSTIGIIGGTGSAKTTLIQLIPRLYDVTVGAVKVGGRDVREYDLQALRDAVAVVLQKNSPLLRNESRKTSAGAIRMPQTRS